VTPTRRRDSDVNGNLPEKFTAGPAVTSGKGAAYFTEKRAAGQDRSGVPLKI
jgi:hypothetical protein